MTQILAFFKLAKTCISQMKNHNFHIYQYLNNLHLAWHASRNTTIALIQRGEKTMKTKLTSAMALLMAMGLGTAVYAGDSYDRAAPDKGAAPQAQDVPTDFSDADLKKFAAVQDDLENIRGEYSGKLENTEDPDQAAQLQQEASQKMVQVVQDAGMDVETYSNIALALQSNAELRDKVQSMMN